MFFVRSPSPSCQRVHQRGFPGSTRAHNRGDSARSAAASDSIEHFGAVGAEHEAEPNERQVHHRVPLVPQRLQRLYLMRTYSSCSTTTAAAATVAVEQCIR